MQKSNAKKLMESPIGALNMGLEQFAQQLEQEKEKVLHINWRPPAQGKQHLLILLDRIKQFQKNS